MGVLDFLKKSPQQDTNSQQGAASFQTQNDDDDNNDVQASYGSFFGNSSVSYPLPSAGAPLTPNYGGQASPQTNPAQNSAIDPNQFAQSNVQSSSTQTAMMNDGVSMTTQQNPSQNDKLDLGGIDLDFNEELPKISLDTPAPSVQQEPVVENTTKFNFDPAMDSVVFNSQPPTPAKSLNDELDMSFQPAPSVSETVSSKGNVPAQTTNMPQIDWSQLTGSANESPVKPVAPIAGGENKELDLSWLDEFSPETVNNATQQTMSNTTPKQFENVQPAPKKESFQNLKPQGPAKEFEDIAPAPKNEAPKGIPKQFEEITPVEFVKPKTEAANPLDASKFDLPKAPAVEKVPSKSVSNLELKYFKDVAFIGLNSDLNDSNYESTLRSLVSALKSSISRIFLDSSQGYGKVVMDELKDATNLEINGAYLRPYFSAYSDEPNGEIPDLKNYTETLFSNIVERLRYLYTSSELFIVVDTHGLVNLTDIMFLLAMQKMYYGKHKPVILFGEGWKAKLPSLNSLLSADEKDKLYTASDVAELQQIVQKVEEGYNKNNFYATKRVTDLRDIEDEKQFMM